MKRKCGAKRTVVNAWICHGQITTGWRQAWGWYDGGCFPPPSSLPCSFIPFLSLSTYLPSLFFRVYLTCNECSNFIWIDKGPVTCSFTLKTDLEWDERNKGRSEEGWKKEGNGCGHYYLCLSYVNVILPVLLIPYTVFACFTVCKYSVKNKGLFQCWFGGLITLWLHSHDVKHCHV